MFTNNKTDKNFDGDSLHFIIQSVWIYYERIPESYLFIISYQKWPARSILATRYHRES